MPSLVWSDALKLDNPRMDDTHREFVDLLNRLEAAPDDEVLPRFRRLVEHTVGHFAQEDRWMQATGFAPQNCHTGQHAQVLQILQALLERADLAELRRATAELAQWFEHHAQTMDAALAFHCVQRGYDTTEERFAAGREPVAAAEAAPITGCGSHACA
ncbi:hemerythrin domain-containing protein [Eleftheria terrae]|uniref:hemerythrin domain-containing protein n=1 Tax=Eleftheria terrae TaxID=1597781 RepID=UPI00263B9686|nr:hemerythrin domain-containing protein [Eleftheria terrae]WKB52381.1 hemerythrin domain-containing protein [Eleftheria terrae]